MVFISLMYLCARRHHRLRLSSSRLPIPAEVSATFDVVYVVQICRVVDLGSSRKLLTEHNPVIVGTRRGRRPN